MTVDSASTGVSASGEGSLFKGASASQRLGLKSEIFKVFRWGGVGWRDAKDSGHAFLVGMLFVLMFVWLPALVCICCVCMSPSVSISVSRPRRVSRVPVSYIVRELPSLSAQCALETVVVLCRLGLPGLGVCVVSLLCLLVLSFSFVRLSFGCSVRSFFALFLHSSNASHVQVFSHANANEAQQLTFERFITAAPPVLSKEHTARTRDPQVCSCRILLASLSVAMMHQIVQTHSKQ